MSATKTIDVKGLGHSEKEGLIFPGIDSLKPGESLRISVEFNPIPLVYMLKATGKYEISFDKEGPDEWLMIVKRTGPAEIDKKEQLRQLVMELGNGEVSEESRAKAKKLFDSVDAKSLGLLEQELVREGVSHEAIRSSLCDIHLEAMRDSLVAKRIAVEAPHPIHTFMEEHKVVLQNLKDLAAITKKLSTTEKYADMGDDRAKLEDISHHLVEAESHHRREEEVLFPRMEAHDVVEPPKIMKLDHVEFRKRKQALYGLTHDPVGTAFSEYRAGVIELGEYLAKELDSHIFKEDNILYQIALQVLRPEEWDEVKRACDEIGYCCFTPITGTHSGKGEHVLVKDLDLRNIEIWNRHDRIFQEWGALRPGQTLRITNDHDPKPLRYQFEAEYKGQYEWEYEQPGPRDWIVKIKRV